MIAQRVVILLLLYSVDEEPLRNFLLHWTETKDGDDNNNSPKIIIISPTLSQPQ